MLFYFTGFIIFAVLTLTSSEILPSESLSQDDLQIDDVSREIKEDEPVLDKHEQDESVLLDIIQDDVHEENVQEDDDKDEFIKQNSEELKVGIILHSLFYFHYKDILVKFIFKFYMPLKRSIPILSYA